MGIADIIQFIEDTAKFALIKSVNAVRQRTHIQNIDELFDTAIVESKFVKIFLENPRYGGAPTFQGTIDVMLEGMDEIYSFNWISKHHGGVLTTFPPEQIMVEGINPKDIFGTATKVTSRDKHKRSGWIEVHPLKNFSISSEDVPEYRVTISLKEHTLFGQLFRKGYSIQELETIAMQHLPNWLNAEMIQANANFQIYKLTFDFWIADICKISEIAVRYIERESPHLMSKKRLEITIINSPFSKKPCTYTVDYEAILRHIENKDERYAIGWTDGDEEEFTKHWNSKNSGFLVKGYHDSSTHYFGSLLTTVTDSRVIPVLKSAFSRKVVDDPKSINELKF